MEINTIHSRAQAKPSAGVIPIYRRIFAYLLILAGYFFYCYNWLLTDYVRPYLMSSLSISLGDTAFLSVLQNIGVTIGSLAAAIIVARIGRREGVVVIMVGAGVLTGINIFAHSLFSWAVLRFTISLLLGGYYVASVAFMVGMFPAAYRARLQALNSGMYSLAEVALGGFGAYLGDAGWQGLMWIGAVPPILIGISVYFGAPNDRRFTGFGEERDVSVHEVPASGGWSEMLSAQWRWITLSCVFLAGLNFVGYQLFSSFVTVYLRTERGFDATAMGALVAFIGTGSLVGGFFWAWIADRFGRRTPRFGFIGTAICVLAFLAAPADPIILTALGAAYGFCVSCTYSWGVYFTEIFPQHLRPFGAALFHGGHIISIAAPILTASVSATWGLGTAMALAPISFLAAVILWSRLPETMTSNASR